MDALLGLLIVYGPFIALASSLFVAAYLIGLIAEWVDGD